MAELSLTFLDFQIRVAEYLGVAYYGANGDEAAQAPVDAHDLDMVKRIVNDGYRRFLTDNHRWNFLRSIVSITFGTGAIPGTDNSEYGLPSSFSGWIQNRWTYAENTGYPPIEATDVTTIREWQALGTHTGNPTHFAVYVDPVTPMSSTPVRHRVVFWPYPDGTQTVSSIFRKFSDRMVDDDHLSIAGFKHDRTVLAAALAEAEIQRGDVQGVREQAYQQALQQSIAYDSMLTKRARNRYGDPSAEDVVGRSFEVVTYNGNPINP